MKKKNWYKSWFFIVIVYPIFTGLVVLVIYNSIKKENVSPESSKELYKKTVRLVQELTSFLAEWKSSEPGFDTHKWDESTKESQEFDKKMMSQYIKLFGQKVATIMESYNRRSMTVKFKDHMPFYIRPINRLGIEDIVAELTKLAEQLKY